MSKEAKNLPADHVQTDEGDFIIERGSGNVFQDLGLEDAEGVQVKAALAAQILRTIRERGLTQKAAAQLSGLKAPDMSNICNARLDGISVERLFNVLNSLGRSIEIHVSSEEREDARTLVTA